MSYPLKSLSWNVLVNQSKLDIQKTQYAYSFQTNCSFLTWTWHEPWFKKWSNWQAYAWTDLDSAHCSAITSSISCHGILTSDKYKNTRINLMWPGYSPPCSSSSSLLVRSQKHSEIVSNIQRGRTEQTCSIAWTSPDPTQLARCLNLAGPKPARLLEQPNICISDKPIRSSGDAHNRPGKSRAQIKAYICWAELKSLCLAVNGSRSLVA